MNLIRLSIMMFLQFCVFGATLPIFSLFWKNHLHLTGAQMGIIFSLSSLSSLISPIITSFIADKYLKSKHLLSISNIVMGISLIAMRMQNSFNGILTTYLLYSIFMGPIPGLLNAISFHLLGGDERDKFGYVRLWGTMGYMIIGIIISFFYLSLPGNEGKVGDSFVIAGLCAFLLAFYVLWFPSYPTEKLASMREIFPLSAVKLLFNPGVLSLLFFQYIIFVVDRFYFIGTAPFLSSIGIQEKFIMPIMSLGQLVEIFAMMLVGLLVPKLGYKRVFLLGVLAEILRFGFYIANFYYILPVIGVALHGFAYAFVYVTISIFLDEHADVNTRTALHQLFYMISFGVGGIFSNIFAGRMIDVLSSTSGVVNYNLFWLVPLAIAGVTLLLSSVFFPARVKVGRVNAS